jgi:geranylgeranyl reductase family protein
VKEDAEVIIVGAGPAGSTCARLLAERGRSVVLLDKARFPRDKACGGWVNLKVFQDFPELEKLRRRLKGRHRLVDEAFHGLVFHSPDMSRAAEYASREVSGYLVQRKEFDEQLLKLAAACGPQVRVVTGRAVTGVDIGEKGVAVVTANGKRFAGQILVGADGANSTVAHLAGLTEGWPPERQVICLVKEVPLNGRTVTRLYGKHRRIHVSIGYGSLAGYAWAFPKRAGVNLGIGCRADVAKDLPLVFARWIADLERARLLPEKCRIDKPVMAMVPAGGAIEYEGHVGKRTALIGDAGGFVSAATGEGIYPALLSARVAAGCIDDALASNHPQDVLMEYKFAWRRAFASYIQMPNANLSFLLPLVYDNAELCQRFARCYLFGESF